MATQEQAKMWFRGRRALTNNVAALLETAHSTNDKLVEWMRWDAAIVRYALRNGGAADLTVPNDDLRLLLAEQLAALLMAKENLLLLQEKKHLFSIKSIFYRSIRKTSRNALPKFGLTCGPIAVIPDTNI